MSRRNQETITSRVMSGVLTTLIAAFVIGAVTVVSTVISLKTFADEGKRYTQEEHDVDRVQIYDVIRTMRSDMQLTRESVIRMEAINSEQVKLLQRLVE